MKHIIVGFTKHQPTKKDFSINQVTISPNNKKKNNCNTCTLEFSNTVHMPCFDYFLRKYLTRIKDYVSSDFQLGELSRRRTLPLRV